MTSLVAGETFLRWSGKNEVLIIFVMYFFKSVHPLVRSTGTPSIFIISLHWMQTAVGVQLELYTVTSGSVCAALEFLIERKACDGIVGRDNV